jgi:DNA-binding MarR family transcriptional regulator
MDIVKTVPLAFHRLRAVSEALHAQDGITAPMRGVMQSLFDGPPLTVPQLAAARPVSRQHIQKQVDELLSRGLVRAEKNPSHKRSPLIVLTDAGRARFSRIRTEEREILSGFASWIPADDLDTTARTLSTLSDWLLGLSGTLQETDHDT